MIYRPSGFRLLASNAWPRSPSLWSYSTDDACENVEDREYFGGSALRNMKVGDVVIVSDLKDGEARLRLVTAVADGNITIAG